MRLPSIYYLCQLPVLYGGQIVNFQHVSSLREQGFRAFALVDPQVSQIVISQQPYVTPIVSWSSQTILNEQDYLVLPEVMPPEVFSAVAMLSCQKVIHNQNPYYTSKGFQDIESLNAYPLAGGLCCSHFTKNLLQSWGSTSVWQVVHPFILPQFTPTQKRQQIAYMPRKRPETAEKLKQLFQETYPQFAYVPWVKIENVRQIEVAKILGESLIFVSLSQLEGLGLPPLEAMSAQCIVCGFDGGGGKEYATSQNGLWVEEGDLNSFVKKIARALNLNQVERQSFLMHGEQTAQLYNKKNFDQELLKAWQEILDTHEKNYRLSY